MIPLRITATTPHGIVLSRAWGIAFDGLLASVLWHRRKREAQQAGAALTYQPELVPELLDLPLERCGHPQTDPNWHWMATFADCHPAGDTADIRWRTSRTDHTRLQQLSPVIGGRVVADRAGRYQQRIIPVMAHAVQTVTWRAVGNPDLIRDLLTDLPSIGKHRGTGEGVVSNWHITECPEEQHWSFGHEHEPGILGRSTPLRCLADHTPIPTTGGPGHSAIRPPYLNPHSRTDVHYPTR